MSDAPRPPHPPDDLHELVGGDLPPEEVEQIRHADALLRRVGPPPAQVPPSLTRAVTRIARERERPLLARRGLAVALAAALSAVFFGLGVRLGADDFNERLVIPLQATPHAGGAAAVIRVGEPDAAGNWPLRLEVRGLEPLPRGGYYVLWLAKDGEYGGTCGTFRVDRDGSAEVEMSASYRISDFDAWVVTARRPGDRADAEATWLLEAEIVS